MDRRVWVVFQQGLDGCETDAASAACDYYFESFIFFRVVGLRDLFRHIFLIMMVFNLDLFRSKIRGTGGNILHYSRLAWMYHDIPIWDW